MRMWHTSSMLWRGHVHCWGVIEVPEPILLWQHQKLRLRYLPWLNVTASWPRWTNNTVKWLIRCSNSQSSDNNNSCSLPPICADRPMLIHRAVTAVAQNKPACRHTPSHRHKWYDDWREYRHFGPRTLWHQCQNVRKTLRSCRSVLGPNFGRSEVS